MFVKGQEQLIGPWGSEQDSEELLKMLRAKPMLKTSYRRNGQERQAKV